jgi:hypothetical protein
MQPQNSNVPPDSPEPSPIPSQPTNEIPSVQPAADAQVTTGMTPPTSSVRKKHQTIALVLGILSIVGFFVGLYFGYSAAIASIAAAYTLAIGLRSQPKRKDLLIIGAIGLLLNFGMFTLATFSNL